RKPTGLGRLFAMLVAALVTVAGVALAACSSGASSKARSSAPTVLGSSAPASAAAVDPRIKRVFVIVLENESGAAAARDPYLAELAGRGATLTHYYGVAHPSQPNYVAMIAGAPLVTDDSPHNLSQTNLVDLLEKAHRSWKTYQEDYPGGCFSGATAGNARTGIYVRKHDPFISFDDVRTVPGRCAKIVPASDLADDIANGQLPDFSFFSPNLNNDGHDSSLAVASAWLQGFLEPKLADPKFADGTLVVVTFDEGTGDPASQPLYAILLGPMVVKGSVDGTPYTHYSLLRTVENVLGLGSLGRQDAGSSPFAACNFTTGC
ncbi:MAG TPA: alkaline phosphatase family protein, partial [Tepidiformaceae bacterium]|nr:alkaline phosphatase family protein [Tepidiformaceae bacterium]